MKTAEIDWALFWSAYNQQKAEQVSAWLGRWVFDDDRVRLAMSPLKSNQ